MEAFILSAQRTPIGSFQGILADFSAPELGAHAIRAAVSNAGVEVEQIEEVFMGNVIGAGVRQAPARQAMRQAGLLDQTPSTTVNKVCGSGMRATMFGIDQIRLGHEKCVVTGGMESMTNAPYIVANARRGYRMGHGELQDTMFTDGLEDASTGKSMGSFAQQTADSYQLTREDMDAFAIESVSRSLSAMDYGVLGTEIAAIDGVEEDEQPRRAKVDRIPSLRPAFAKDGTITAANASSISDGASALVLGDEETANSSSSNPLARVVTSATHARHPAEFTLAPIGAIEKVLHNAGWTAADVDLFEINEAFAMVTMLTSRELGLDPTKVNLYGGACAEGHPIGSTGSRLIVTLAHALHRENAKRGVAALCIGGGEATAVALEIC